MEKMLAVVFDSESKAYQGSRALAQLDAEGSIAIHARVGHQEERRRDGYR